MIRKFKIKDDINLTIKDIVCPKCAAVGKQYTIVWGHGTKAAVEPKYECKCYERR